MSISPAVSSVERRELPLSRRRIYSRSICDILRLIIGVLVVGSIYLAGRRQCSRSRITMSASFSTIARDAANCVKCYFAPRIFLLTARL